jgi:hypothetical protein
VQVGPEAAEVAVPAVNADKAEQPSHFISCLITRDVARLFRLGAEYDLAFPRGVGFLDDVPQRHEMRLPDTPLASLADAVLVTVTTAHRSTPLR